MLTRCDFRRFRLEADARVHHLVATMTVAQGEYRQFEQSGLTK
jgi:hypothetical protein